MPPFWCGTKVSTTRKCPFHCLFWFCALTKQHFYSHAAASLRLLFVVLLVPGKTFVIGQRSSQDKIGYLVVLLVLGKTFVTSKSCASCSWEDVCHYFPYIPVFIYAFALLSCDWFGCEFSVPKPLLTEFGIHHTLHWRVVHRKNHSIWTNFAYQTLSRYDFLSWLE